MDDSHIPSKESPRHYTHHQFVCYIYNESFGGEFIILNIGMFLILKIQIMLLSFFPLKLLLYDKFKNTSLLSQRR